MRGWTFVVLATLLGLISGCSQPMVKPTQKATVDHVILLWLKNPGDVSQRAQIIEVTKELEKLPGVIKIRTGEVIKSERPIVDDSFDVGVHMLFADEQALAQYQQHPEHVRTVNQVIKPLIKKILIYDFKE